MESESGSKRNADELQSPAVQDEAIRSIAASDVSYSPFPIGSPLLEDMLVIHLPNRMVRCFVQREQWSKRAATLPLRSLMVREQGRNAATALQVDAAKAIFFVRSFGGKATHVDLRFHDDMTPPERLWLRLTFPDGEVMEGLANNDGEFALRASFFLHPVDPDSNYWLVHVFKRELIDLQVLGLRAASSAKDRG